MTKYRGAILKGRNFNNSRCQLADQGGARNSKAPMGRPKARFFMATGSEGWAVMV
ncbi:MAG: hypothetical protein FWH27_14160 [Planctomycetaceae bacterium]|nr:hypothetical protein [Planctomycetaceae bacterium]